MVDLTGDNAYTGGTSIQDTGTLAIGSDQALGNPDGGVTFWARERCRPLAT